MLWPYYLSPTFGHERYYVKKCNLKAVAIKYLVN